MTVITYGPMKLKDFHLLAIRMEFWYLEDVIFNKFALTRFGFNKRIIVILLIKIKEAVIVILDI